MKEEELLRKRLDELGKKAYHQNIYTHTHFLTEYEQSIYKEMEKELSFIDSSLIGGHDYFTRGIVVFGSENMFGYQGEILLACAKISPIFDKFAEELSHRDYLGALMNLGIERHQLGDILVNGKIAYVFCFPHMIEFLKDNFSQVRHTRVQVEEVALEECKYTQKFQEKEGFVASLRLDVLVAFCFGLSRSASQGLLKGQKIFVNGKMTVQGDEKIALGDVVSVRGYGKFLIGELGKLSKKGRQFISIKKFI